MGMCMGLGGIIIDGGSGKNVRINCTYKGSVVGATNSYTHR